MFSLLIAISLNVTPAVQAPQVTSLRPITQVDPPCPDPNKRKPKDTGAGGSR